jgi:hypothetical protein
MSITLELSPSDLLRLAMITSLSAGNAYDDERLHTALSEHNLAARLWRHLDSPSNMNKHRALAIAIENELIELASDPTDERI